MGVATELCRVGCGSFVANHDTRYIIIPAHYNVSSTPAPYGTHSLGESERARNTNTNKFFRENLISLLLKRFHENDLPNMITLHVTQITGSRFSGKYKCYVKLNIVIKAVNEEIKWKI